MQRLDDTLVQRALEAGRDVDLQGCTYGPAHWQGEQVSTSTAAYYGLLAGLVRVSGARTVVELGTHYGGATLAMARGFADPGASLLVTVDVTAIENPRLLEQACVRRVQGDVFSPQTLSALLRALDGRPVDLLFIDIVHGYHQTLRALGLYANRLQPALIALDDIHLNGGMRLLWRELAERHPAMDVSARVDREAAGFGLLQPALPLRLPEGEAWRSALWSLRRTVAAQTPYPLKRGATALLDALPAGIRKRLDPS